MGCNNASVTPTAERTIPVRRVDIDFDSASIPRHYMADGMVASHVVTVLSCLFPSGEDFFVDSVRHYRDRVTDPGLRRQVTAFVGQEAIHSREHRAVNDALGRLGYPTATIDRNVTVALRTLRRLLPPPMRLAVTAALEHYTATLAYLLLSDPAVEGMALAPEIRAIFTWHAIEEFEHKAVAFDVYQLVSGNHALRSITMRLTTVGFLIAVAVGTVQSLLSDPDARHPRALLASLRASRSSPFVSRALWSRIRDYHRRDFHPDDHDDPELLERWVDRLFGPAGEMVGSLR